MLLRACVANMVTKFSLHPDPSQWGYDVSPKSVDDDDWLHKPEMTIDATGSIWNSRGIPTIGCLVLLTICLIGLLCVYHTSSAARAHFHQSRFPGSRRYT